MEVTGEPSTENELINDDWRVWILFIVCFIVYGMLFLQFGRWLGAVDPELGIVYYFWHDCRIIPGYFIGYLAAMLIHKVIKQIPEGREELRTWLEERKERRSRSR